VCNPHEGFSLAPARLLLVDDDDSVLTGLGVVLEAHDFEVVTASNVTEALRLIASQAFDVLVTDLHMPGAGDGLVVAGAMRHAHPAAVTLVLSANPDMGKATAAILRQVDQILTKPVKAGAIVENIRARLEGEPLLTLPEKPVAAQAKPEPAELRLSIDPPSLPEPSTVQVVASLLERERAVITQSWLEKISEAVAMSEVRLTPEERSADLPEMLNEVIYRLQYPQPLGLMTLFSMASLQHGARRRRQGFRSPVLVEEARAMQVAVFQAIHSNLDRVDLSQLPVTLMAIADEVNAQLLQSLSGYENEKPVEFSRDDR
jgi:DNA-binding NarL/FixJ family response regulator